MSDNAEEGIARAQLAGKSGVAEYQKKSSLTLDGRIMTALFGLGFLGLMVVWATAESPLLIYGCPVVAFLGVILFGVMRVRRIERVREERKRQVEDMQSASKD